METGVQSGGLNLDVSEEALQELSKALELEEYKGKAVRVAIAGVG